MGTLLTVVGGCLRGGAAAFSFSQRSWAAWIGDSGHVRFLSGAASKVICASEKAKHATRTPYERRS